MIPRQREVLNFADMLLSDVKLLDDCHCSPDQCGICEHLFISGPFYTENGICADMKGWTAFVFNRK